jgi:hypothetical protein
LQDRFFILYFVEQDQEKRSKQEGAGVIITTTDPITGEDIPHPETKPYVVEGEGHLAVKIYFESEETRRAYLDIDIENPGNHFIVNLDNPDPDMGNYN